MMTTFMMVLLTPTPSHLFLHFEMAITRRFLSQQQYHSWWQSGGGVGAYGTGLEPSSRTHSLAPPPLQSLHSPPKYFFTPLSLPITEGPSSSFPAGLLPSFLSLSLPPALNVRCSVALHTVMVTEERGGGSGVGHHRRRAVASQYLRSRFAGITMSF